MTNRKPNRSAGRDTVGTPEGPSGEPGVPELGGAGAGAAVPSVLGPVTARFVARFHPIGPVGSVPYSVKRLIKYQ